MDRMLCAAADLAIELGTYWVGAEHLARMILRRGATNDAPEQLRAAPTSYTTRLPRCRISAAHAPRPLARSPCARYRASTRT